MADKDYKVFIVEGEAREPRIIDNISGIFFGEDIIDVFAMKISCLWKMSDIMRYEQHLGEVTPNEIYVMEAKETEKERVFVLSVFSEFLIDYFGMKLWKTCVKHGRNKGCNAQ